MTWVTHLCWIVSACPSRSAFHPFPQLCALRAWPVWTASDSLLSWLGPWRQQWERRGQESVFRELIPLVALYWVAHSLFLYQGPLFLCMKERMVVFIAGNKFMPPPKGGTSSWLLRVPMGFTLILPASLHHILFSKCSSSSLLEYALRVPVSWLVHIELQLWPLHSGFLKVRWLYEVLPNAYRNCFK